MFFFKKKNTPSAKNKNKLPKSLVALKDQKQPSWVWDPEYRIIIWSNTSGLAFWNVNNRTEIKELIFPEMHSMVTICDKLSKRMLGNKPTFHKISLVNRHSASIIEYNSKIETQKLPDDRNGYLITILDEISDEQVISNSVEQTPNERVPEEIQEKMQDHKDNEPQTQLIQMPSITEEPANFSCDENAIITKLDKIAEQNFGDITNKPLISLFKNKQIGHAFISDLFAQETLFSAKLLDLGSGELPYLVQSAQTKSDNAHFIDVGFLQITNEQYDEFHKSNDDTSDKETLLESKASDRYDDDYLASSVMGDLAGVDVGILDVDSQGSILKVNQMACQLMGHETEVGLVGQNVINLFGLEAQSVLNELLFNTNPQILDDLADGVQCTFIDGYGTERTTKLIVRQNRSKDGFWFILNDNTEIEQMKSELSDLKEQAEKNPYHEEDHSTNEIPDLVSAVSHELRAPLNAISGYAEMIEIRSNETLDTHSKNFISSIRGASRYALSIVEELLDYSKLKAGGFIADFSKVNLEPVIDDAISTVYPMAYARNISIVKTCLPNTPAIKMDARLLKQVLINLLTNAIKYSYDNNKVILTAGLTKTNRLMIEVVDYGRGMREEEIHEALTPFKRGHYQNDVPGTGLGLSLSRELTEITGGRFTISSKVDEITRIRMIYEQESLYLDDDTPSDEIFVS